MKQSIDHKETGIIREIEESDSGYTIHQVGGLSLFLDKKHNAIPKKGDEITIHTKGGVFGTIRGIYINGEIVFWKTDANLENARQEWLAENEEKKQRRFNDNLARMNKRYDSLPKQFQNRIDKFREKNDRFRIDYEEYELFCCEQAVIIAKGCKTKEAVQVFKEKKWKEQIKQIKKLSSDHSGNTFGCACYLAYWYLEDPENVVKVHGALAPLVGTDKYGG